MPQTKDERRKTGRRRVEVWITERRLGELDRLALENGFTRAEMVEVLIDREQAERAHLATLRVTPAERR